MFANVFVGMTAKGAKQASDVEAGVEIGVHIERLRRQLRRKLACEHDAEDLAQEACLRFFVEWQRRDDIRNPRAYLQQIARNLLYLHYTNRANRVTDTGIELDAMVAEVPDTVERINDALRVQTVNRACRELSPKCQQALRLRWREGLRVAEIAEQMNLSTGMVKKYLAQGLAHCRKRLGRIIEEDRVAA